VLGDVDWGSTMAAAGVTPDLGGTLRVRFADQANLASMVGTTFDFFDWRGGLDTNNRFDSIELPPGTRWDLSRLYLTGTAKLTAIPEPSAVLLLACGTAASAVARLRILSQQTRLARGDIKILFGSRAEGSQKQPTRIDSLSNHYLPGSRWDDLSRRECAGQHRQRKGSKQ
jgi:hypothetical protein